VDEAGFVGVDHRLYAVAQVEFLTNINEALYVGNWFLSAVFLLAAGALALTSARRALGWCATALARLSLAAAAAPTNGLAEDTVLLWFIRIVWTSISLGRGERARTPAVVIA